MTTRMALAQSRNTIAVDVLERTGIANTITFVRKFGINSPIVENYTMALGSSEMTLIDVTNAYATIADEGVVKAPVFITKIQQGAQTITFPTVNPHRAIEPEVAFVLTSMLQSVAKEGTAARILGKWKRDVAAKTGTTNDAKDAWLVGFTPDLACGVYVGFDDPKTLGKGEGGSTTALPIFSAFMSSYLDNQSVLSFKKPDSVVELEVDAATGLLPRQGATRREVFLVGTQPNQRAPSPDDRQNWMMRQVEISADEISPQDIVVDVADSEDAF